MPRPQKDKDFYWAIGDRMRRTRLERGVNRERVSTALSISSKQLGNYEKGKNAAPLVILVEFAEIMYVSLKWLVHGEVSGQIGDVVKPPQLRLRPSEQEIVNAYRHIEDPEDRRVLRRIANIMAQGNKTFDIKGETSRLPRPDEDLSLPAISGAPPASLPPCPASRP